MQRQEKIKQAYEYVGSAAKFYDGMMTYSSILGKFISRLVWDLNAEKNRQYVDFTLAGIPEHFSGRLLEIPIGTGCLTLPFYKNFPNADIVCVDYSDKMLKAAKERTLKLQLNNINFIKGDIVRLPFEDNSFDIVLTLNGLHVFPDKETAFSELNRVLKTNGIFCGTCYVNGENCKTDFFIKFLYVNGGFFTPPFDTVESLIKRLNTFYRDIKIKTTESEASFICRKI